MRWGCQRNNQRSPKTLLFVFRRFAAKKWLIDLKVTPFFKKIPLNEIKPTHVRQWQNSLTSYRDENGKPYAQTYLKCINNQLTAIFNYAVKYYGLKENPCHKAGSMGKKKADEMLFWTKEEYKKFSFEMMEIFLL